jgi:RNA polymerase sigma-70 factor (ECF subfamily)
MTADRLESNVAFGGPEAARDGPASDWELEQIERARRDPEAFAPLYEAYVDLVWRYMLSRLGDQERAADATSQTFIKAIAALPGFRSGRRPGGSVFRSWLMTIARNVAIDEARKTRYAMPLDDIPAQSQLIDRERSPEEVAIAAAERQRINRALGRLPETQRQIVELRAAGMKGAEIAQLLNMTIGAVKTANHRAYSRLRELLDEDGSKQDLSS